MRLEALVSQLPELELMMKTYISTTFTFVNAPCYTTQYQKSYQVEFLVFALRIYNCSSVKNKMFRQVCPPPKTLK